MHIYFAQLAVNIDLKMQGTNKFTRTIVFSAWLDPIL